MTAGEERHQHQQDVDRGHHAGLGRREPSGQDAPHDDQWDHQRQYGGAYRIGEFAKRSAWLLETDRAEKVGIDHQSNADDEARRDAGQKQPADRDIAGRAVDHCHDARRDEVGHGRGAGNER
jgi:hypothetical protein